MADTKKTQVVEKAEDDGGSTTAERFRYQWLVAALYCCGLLDPDCHWDAVFCEQHEDILLSLKAGGWRAIQVKTRGHRRAHLKANDEEVMAALVRFVKLERSYGCSIDQYVLATNHGFSSSSRSGISLPTVLDVARGSSSCAEKAVTRLVSSLADRANATGDEVVATLRKTHCYDDLPKLRDADLRLEHDLGVALGPLPTVTRKQVAAAARALVGAVMRASADAAVGALPVYRRSNGELVVDAARLEAKRFDVAAVRRAIDPYLTPSTHVTERRPPTPAMIEYARAAAPLGIDWDVLQTIHDDLEAGRFSDSPACRFGELAPGRIAGRSRRLVAVAGADGLTLSAFPHLRDPVTGVTTPKAALGAGAEALYVAVPAKGIVFRLRCSDDRRCLVIVNDNAPAAGHIVAQFSGAVPAKEAP